MSISAKLRLMAALEAVVARRAKLTTWWRVKCIVTGKNRVVDISWFKIPLRKAVQM
jgi:hypothetical protein